MMEELTNSGIQPGMADRAATWFVGASYDDGTDDQAERFLAEGIWENGHVDRYLDEVRSVRAGDRIVIKSVYTRKHGLHFESHGKTVSVMGIKAVGTVTENPGDGNVLRVNWTDRHTPPREWYFSALRPTISKPNAGDWATAELLAFVIDGKPQDIPRFLADSRWRAKYTDSPASADFPWTGFYQATARKLLDHQADRTQLVRGINAMAERLPLMSYLKDQFADGTVGPLRDICPYTTLGIFNRKMTLANRRQIAAELAQLLGVQVPVPASFEGVPLLNNQKSWFFSYAARRGEADIDKLWTVFAAAAKLADRASDDAQQQFIAAYDSARLVVGVKWNLSIGLYWSHPWTFPTLDSGSRDVIERQLDISIGEGGNVFACSGKRYLDIAQQLSRRFEDPDFFVHSFPELSLRAWKEGDSTPPSPDTVVSTRGPQVEAASEPPRLPPYDLDSIVADGCFLEYGELLRMLRRLRDKKNVILQGPPGTGKTWLATRLAYALIGCKDDTRVRAVQFHPSLSYEDFVRGFKPTSNKGFLPADGIFLEAVRQASSEPESDHVVVIEEINRGNPAQIFGELLTLLENTKRGEAHKLTLCYPDSDMRHLPVSIPRNLYVIGTMNLADRSLALVDMALRRRFAFSI